MICDRASLSEIFSSRSTTKNIDSLFFDTSDRKNASDRSVDGLPPLDLEKSKASFTKKKIIIKPTVFVFTKFITVRSKILLSTTISNKDARGQIYT